MIFQLEHLREWSVLVNNGIAWSGRSLVSVEEIRSMTFLMFPSIV